MTDPTPQAAGGVSRAQFAFLRAGLTDGVTLEALLAYHGLDGPTWEAAEELWNAHVLESIEHETSLLHELDEEMAAARAHWERPIPPLDRDLQAWIDFLRVWADAPEPVEFLTRFGLEPADLARLHARWSERMAGEPSLGAEMLAMLEREPGELCVPRPEPARLRRKVAEGVQVGTQTAEVGFAKLRTLPFGEGKRSPPPRLATPLPGRRRAPTTALGLDETTFLPRAVKTASLPFAPVDADARAEADAEELLPELPVPEPPRATARRIDVSAPPAEASVAALMFSVTAPSILDPLLDDSAEERGTLPPLPPSPGGELPFAPSGGSSRRRGGAPKDSPTVILPMSKPSTLVLLVPPKPSTLVLVAPYDPSPFDDDDDAESGLEGPPSSEVPGGDTAPLPPILPTSRFPFSPAARTVADLLAEGEDTVAIDVSTGTVLPVSSAFGPKPLLTLEQHARLYAELTTAPDQAVEILARYGLTSETKKAEDAYWQSVFNRDPTTRTAWMRVHAGARMKPSKAGEPK